MAVHRQGFTALPAAACGGHSSMLVRTLDPNPTMEDIPTILQPWAGHPAAKRLAMAAIELYR